MRARVVLAVLCCSASGWAGKKTLVVGAGDCKESALLSANKDFQSLAHGQLKADFVEPDGVLRLVRPQADRSIEALQRQVETARSMLYEGKNEEGLASVQDALTDLERVSPQVKPWALTQSALVLQAQILKNLERPKDSAEAFRRVLRVDPAFKLDPGSYPPSTIAALEAVRRELARGRKGLLQVVSNPPQASVFFDGKEVGKTPFKAELPQGIYRVVLVAGETVSFLHRVTLSREQVVQVNMGFEGSVALAAPLCVSGSEDAPAITLASTVGAQQVVVLRNAALRGNPAYLTGTLYEVARGERVRNAGVAPGQLAELMLYLFTGKPDIVSAPLPPPPPPPVLEPAAAAAPEPKARAELAAPGPAVSTGRIVSYVSLGVGAAVGATGVIVYASGGADRSALSALKTSAGKLPDPQSAPGQNAQARGLLSSVTSNQALSFTLIGVGAGALVGGALGLVLFPSSQASVALVPTREGAAVSLSGSF